MKSMEVEVRKAPAQLGPFWNYKKALYYIDSNCQDVYSGTHFSLSIIQLFHSDNGGGRKAKIYSEICVSIFMNSWLEILTETWHRDGTLFQRSIQILDSLVILFKASAFSPSPSSSSSSRTLILIMKQSKGTFFKHL